MVTPGLEFIQQQKAFANGAFSVTILTTVREQLADISAHKRLDP